MSDAIVLSGAALKGSFAAGALAALFGSEARARLGLAVRRIVGASSGALNATFFAANLHAGTESTAGERLARLWIERATLARSLAPSLGAMFGGRGISTAAKILEALRDSIRPCPGVRPVELRLVVTDIDGDTDVVPRGRATTYERVFAFDGADFASAGRLERLFHVATASGAFPGIFEPVRIPVCGRPAWCLDGGITNATPLAHALHDAPDIDRIFVITPTPRVRTERTRLGGLALLSHLSAMLVEERLARDLRHAERVNDALAAVGETLPSPLIRSRVLQALGWAKRRPVEIIEVRPEEPLEGNAFSGWLSRRLREDYVRAGRYAVARVLAARMAGPDTVRDAS